MNISSIIFVCCLVGSLTFASSGAKQERDEDEVYDFVLDECDLKLRAISSISKFNSFVQKFKELDRARKRPKVGLLSKADVRLKKCYSLEEPLLELEQLVAARHELGICHLDYIERLAEFHFKYLARPDKRDKSEPEEGGGEPGSKPKGSHTSYLAYFFSLYAHQIAYNCKRKLIERVEEAQGRADCLTVLFNFMPSLFEPTSSDDNDAANLSEAENFLREFKRVESFAPIAKRRRGSARPQSKLDEAYFEASLPQAALAKVESLKVECRKREPYYRALFAPIATLAHLGYSVDESTSDSSDLNDSHTRLLKCWLATAQLCEGILRTHLKVKQEGDEEATGAGHQEADSKLVSIKLGSLPSDVSGTSEPDGLLGSRRAPGDQLDLELYDTVEEISPAIVELVEKKFGRVAKMKRKALKWAKGFIERHINMEAIQREASKSFLDALTSVDNGVDSRVAFAGKQFDKKKFSPTSIITDDADFVVQLSSSFWNKEVGLLVSSVIALTMSAVFVWFSLYAVASSVSQHYFATNLQPNLRSDWRRIRDERVKRMEDKMKSSRSGDFGKVYKPV